MIALLSSKWRLGPGAGAWHAAHDGIGTSCYQAIWAGDQVVALAVAHDTDLDGEPDTREIARLIAAAPELLLACQGLLHIAETGITSLGAIRAARAALAKATGGVA